MPRSSHHAARAQHQEYCPRVLNHESMGIDLMHVITHIDEFLHNRNVTLLNF